jgi:hypothetical protein
VTPDFLVSGTAGAACGLASLFVMRRFSDQAAIQTAKARIRAHLYELGLFNEDPVLILRAQKNLLRWNIRYLRLSLLPAAIIAIPALLVASQLDALYGRRPLRSGEHTVITLDLRPRNQLGLVAPVISASHGFQVETPAVRIPHLSRIHWRVGAVDNVDGTLRFVLPGETVEAPVRAGTGFRYVSAYCTSSMLASVFYGCRLRSNLVESITIDYPGSGVSVLGIETHWLFWFTLFWLAAMLLLRSRFGVTF